jgi:hypothetical protein
MKATNSITALGLDVGTSRIVLARRTEDRFDYQSELNAFVSIPYSKMTADVLEREQIPHAVEGGNILVHGNESEKLADLLNAETRRPMKNGVLDPKEPESLNVVRTLLSSITQRGVAAEGDRPKKICFTVPAAPLGAEASHTYHEATLRSILSSVGFEAKPINEGLAVIYAELESNNYTGIGISCGGGLCNVCLAYLSVPILSFSVPKAGDYIDQNTSAIIGERANRIRLAKEESFHLNGFFADKVHQVLSVYYDDLIRSLVSALTQAFSRSTNMPKFNRPIPLVLSGGTSLPVGFRDRFEKMLKADGFPLPLSEVRLAEYPLFATAKGALVCALSEG